MAERYETISAKHASFIADQPMFFVATAPHEGHVNLSPKGADTFRVLGPNLAGYLDLTGSGNETAAHIRENGRLTVMFNSFSSFAQILRLYGTGRVVPLGTPEWDIFASEFPDYLGKRQIILIDVEFVQTSCGYAVPEMALTRERPTHIKWAENKGREGLVAYRANKNLETIDANPTGHIEWTKGQK